MKVFFLISELRDLLTWAPVAAIMRHYPAAQPIWMLSAHAEALLSEGNLKLPEELTDHVGLQHFTSTPLSVSSSREAVMVACSSEVSAPLANACVASGLPLVVLDPTADGSDPGHFIDSASLCLATTHAALRNIRLSASVSTHLTGHPLHDVTEDWRISSALSHPALPDKSGRVLRGEKTEEASQTAALSDGLAAVRITEIIMHTFAPENGLA